jgi:Uma2 family endonuclease
MASQPVRSNKGQTPPWVGEPEELSEILDRQPVIRIPVRAGTLDGFRQWAVSDEFPERCRISYLPDHLYIDLEALAIRLPTSAFTLAGFNAWAVSKEFPKHGHISFRDQEIVIDMSPEELETHNQVKTEVARVLSNLKVELDLGKFYGDRTSVTNDAANLSTEPDGVFLTWESIELGRVRLKPRKRRRGQYSQVQGTPDGVLEVVSEHSVRDDTQEMRQLYHRAGVPEYWLIDARGEAIVFQILRWRRTGYVATPRRGGWLRSKVFGRGFRLERRRDRFGLWRYTLHVQPV